MSVTAGYPAAGEEIGPFRVVRRIGAGGMGVVFEAVDQRLDRRVALKVIPPHLAGDAGVRLRLTTEARALAALDSPHVVRVLAHGEAAGHLYLATQLITGGDLAHLIEEVGAPPLRVALDLVGQVAAGLADAHAAGLLHRDLKPANVLVRRRGRALAAYLGDFGVACHARDVPSPGESGPVGTAAWMAPELWSGAPAGVASDVYSLGCLLWATLTGRPPYAGATEDRLAAAHREHPVPQLVGDSLMAREANRILRRSMAKDPSDRHRTAAELRDDLRQAATLVEPAADDGAAASPTRRLATVAAVVVALGAGSVALAGGRDAPPDRASGPAARDRTAAVTSLAGALAERGVLSRAEADCTARRWIGRAGLRRMVAAGFFDADLEFVDRDRSALTPRIDRAATAAARGCALRRRTAPGRGNSNGGLLVAVTALQAPDAFQAVFCRAPILDMIRFTRFDNTRAATVEFGSPEEHPAGRSLSVDGFRDGDERQGDAAVRPGQDGRADADRRPGRRAVPVAAAARLRTWWRHHAGGGH